MLTYLCYIDMYDKSYPNLLNVSQLAGALLLGHHTMHVPGDAEGTDTGANMTSLQIE